MPSDTQDSGTEPQTFGPYALISELGRGGQGTVWLAEDHKLKRRVALKVLGTAPGGLAPDRLQRFQREAEAAARLDDPHICGLLDAGDVDGVPYLAFRHLQGETLAARIARSYEQKDSDDSTSDPSSREGMQWLTHTFEKLARALHKAHESGLVHRDVKPGNIMILPDGEPVLLDFGLARDELSDDHSLTHSGDLLGTPAYMSPEQLMAQRIPLDRRTDVYSLGATLYEALTLEKPFVATTRAELYQKILTTEPSSASSHNRQIPRDLQIVLETAMEKDRNRRYQNASDFAEDLRRVRAFEPVHAKPIGTLLRVKRWAQRHPAVASSVLLGLIALAVTVVLLADTRAALRTSEMMRLVAESAAAEEQDPIGALHTALAAVDLERSQTSIDQVRNVLARPMPREPLAPARGRQNEMRVTSDGQRVLLLDNHLDGSARAVLFHRNGTELSAGDPIQSLDRPSAAWGFSPAGTYTHVHERNGELQIRLAADGSRPKHHKFERVTRHVWTADDRLLVALPGGRVDLVDPHTGSIAVRPSGQPPITSNLLADDLAIVGSSIGLERWPLDGSATPQIVSLPKPPRRLAISAASKTVAAVLADGALVFCSFDAESGARVIGAPKSAVATVDVRVSASGHRFLSFHEDAPARLWDPDGNPIATLERLDQKPLSAIPPGQDHYQHGAAFSPDGRRLVTLYIDLILCVWDEDGRLLSFVRGRPGSTNMYVAWSADGQRLIYATAQHALVLDPDGRVQHDLPHSDLITGIADLGTELWTSVRRQGTHRWDYASLPRRAHEAVIRQIHRQGDQLITASDDGRVRRFRADGTPLQEYPSPDVVSAAALSRDGRWIATGSARGTIRLFSVTGTGPAYEWNTRSPGSVKGITIFGTDPPRVLAAGWHPAAYLCEPGRTEPTPFPLGADGGADILVRDGVVMNAVARFSDTGKDAGVLIWRLDGEVIQKLRIPDGDTSETIACSKDGLVLASSGMTDLHVWTRTATTEPWQEPGRILRGHTAGIWCLDISQDGSHLASASSDGTARVWSVAEGRSIAVLRGHVGPVRSVTFLPDDREVMTTGADGYMRRFLVEGNEVLEVARARAAALAPR